MFKNVQTSSYMFATQKKYLHFPNCSKVFIGSQTTPGNLTTKRCESSCRCLRKASPGTTKSYYTRSSPRFVRCFGCRKHDYIKTCKRNPDKEKGLQNAWGCDRFRMILWNLHVEDLSNVFKTRTVWAATKSPPFSAVSALQCVWKGEKSDTCVSTVPECSDGATNLLWSLLELKKPVAVWRDVWSSLFGWFSLKNLWFTNYWRKISETDCCFRCSQSLLQTQRFIILFMIEFIMFCIWILEELNSIVEFVRSQTTPTNLIASYYSLQCLRLWHPEVTHWKWKDGEINFQNKLKQVPGSSSFFDNGPFFLCGFCWARFFFETMLCKNPMVLGREKGFCRWRCAAKTYRSLELCEHLCSVSAAELRGSGWGAGDGGERRGTWAMSRVFLGFSRVFLGRFLKVAYKNSRFSRDPTTLKVQSGRLWRVAEACSFSEGRWIVWG